MFACLFRCGLHSVSSGPSSPSLGYCKSDDDDDDDDGDDDDDDDDDDDVAIFCFDRSMQRGSCRVIQFAVFCRGHRRLICALLHRQQVSQQHTNAHTVAVPLTKLCFCLSQFATLDPAFFHFSSGTSGDWVFEGAVVTFADVIAAWTSVHGDGGW